MAAFEPHPALFPCPSPPPQLCVTGASYMGKKMGLPFSLFRAALEQAGHPFVVEAVVWTAARSKWPHLYPTNSQLKPTLLILFRLRVEEKKQKILRNTRKVHSPEAKLTKRLRPTHKTTECFPSPQHLITTLLNAYLQQFTLPSTLCPAIKNKL